MKDTTINKLITDDIKLVAFKRESNDFETIFRLVDFTFGTTFSTDFESESDLTEAFAKEVSCLES